MTQPEGEFPNQLNGWVQEDDGTWSLYSSDGTKVISSRTDRAQVSMPLTDFDIANKVYVDENGGGGSMTQTGFRFRVNGITTPDDASWHELTANGWTDATIDTYLDLPLLDGAVFADGGDPSQPAILEWSGGGVAYVAFECFHDDGLTIGVDTGTFAANLRASDQPSAIQVMLGDAAAIAEDEDTIGLSMTLRGLVDQGGISQNFVRIAFYNDGFDVANKVSLLGCVIVTQ